MDFEDFLLGFAILADTDDIGHLLVLIVEGLSTTSERCIEGEAIVREELDDFLRQSLTAKSVGPEAQRDILVHALYMV